MIKLVDLTFYAHLNYNQPEQVIENHAPALAFAPYLKNKLDFSFVKHAAFEQQINVDGIPYYFFKGQNRFWSVSFKTYRFIRKLKPDIVLVQGLVFPLQVLLLRLLCDKNLKIIIQHHGELPFHGLKGLIQKLACKLLSAVIFTAAGNALVWKKRNIIKTGTPIFELLEASTNFKQQDRQISKQRTGIGEATTFLWVGRLNANKDPLTVLSGFNKYLLANPQAKLYMIYQTEDMLREVVQMFATNPLLSNAVALVGKVSNAELPYWYSAADFYISGSHKEGSGYALMEAMACGCIPVATAIPPYKKITGDGKCGFLYPTGNAVALAALLITIDGLNREKLVGDTLSYFQENLTFKNIADDLVNICNSLLAK